MITKSFSFENAIINIDLEFYPVDTDKDEWLQYAYIKMIAPIGVDLGMDGYLAHNQMLRNVPEVEEWIGGGTLTNHQSYSIDGKQVIHWMVN